jgi:hypothetical protein
VTVGGRQGGLNPDSMPFIGEHRRVYASPYRYDSSLWSLPVESQPGARRLDGVGGNFLRYLLGGVTTCRHRGRLEPLAREARQRRRKGRARSPGTGPI